MDLTDTYLVVKILPEHTSFLKFKFNSVLYKYLVMCFGIHSAPRSFTKLLRVPLSELRSNGHIVSAYLDDSLQIAGSFQECVNTVVSTHNLFVDLGFLPNFKKSHYIPSQRIVILGSIIDSVDMTVALTQDKINPFPAVDKYICFGVFALYARVPEQLVHLGSLCSTYKLCA